MTIAMKTPASEVELPYRLASSARRPDERTVLDIAGRRLGGESFAIIAGPCTVESREQTLETARAVSATGATLGADGIIVEVHPDPDQAICDGPQQLVAAEFDQFADQVAAAAALAGKVRAPATLPMS